MAKRATRGEQSRSESITTRLHPQLKFGLELLARQQHRSASAVLETLLEKSLAEQAELDIDALWHPNEVIRALRMSKSPIASRLLSYEEGIALERLSLIFCEEDHQELWRIAEFAGYARTRRQAALLTALDAIWPTFKSLVSRPGGITPEDGYELRNLADAQIAFLEQGMDQTRLVDAVGRLAETKN